MSEFYLKYLDLVEDSKVKELVKCIVDETNNGESQTDLISTKENIENMCNDDETLLKETRIKILRYLYVVWLDGIQGGPAEWWCEMLPEIKKLVIVATSLESLSREILQGDRPMEIAQVLIRLWDYIKTQEKNDNWNYVMNEYDDLCRKHNDLRELYFL